MTSLRAQVLAICLVSGTAAGAGEAQAATPPPLSRDSTVLLYCAAWGAADRAERDRLLERVWATDGVYLDQGTRAEGRTALSDAIGRSVDRNPGLHFQCSRPHAHHDVMRFTWIARRGDETEILSGMDFGEFAPDGRIRRIVGFFGPLPPATP